MTVTLTPQVIITAGGVVTALVVVGTQVVKFVRWVDQQKKQDKEIELLRQQHNADMAAQREEQMLLTYGVLACLKGLKEQGCNGPVTEAIHKIEKYLNNKAHAGDN